MAKVALVVDDSKVVRIFGRRILEELGFSVIEAEDGKVALDQCQLGIPDIILLDWNMPVMNGLEFIQALRKMPTGQTVPVIFCTTENEMSKIMAALESGANEYIMKPFDKEIVSGKLSQLGLL
jgi:two-component system chemotaxis response regulator CheY